MLDWSLETELFSPFFFFFKIQPAQARSQLPTLSGGFSKEQKLLCNSLHCQWGGGGSMKQTETPRVCVHTHKPIVLDISVELISEDYFNDNLTLSSICLSLQLCPKNGRDLGVCGSKLKLRTQSGAICSGFAYLIMNVFQRPQDK